MIKTEMVLYIGKSGQGVSSTFILDQNDLDEEIHSTLNEYKDSDMNWAELTMRITVPGFNDEQPIVRFERYDNRWALQ